MIRLLDRTQQGRYQLSSFDDAKPPQYAILSHTWSHGHEVEYNDLIAGGEQKKLGYTKMKFCVDQAQKDGLQYCWIDTCCIDKASSAELSAAINSMFRWYRRAAKCYVFLADVGGPGPTDDENRSNWIGSFQRSKWFTRGWTLQELLAPPVVEFFSCNGYMLGTRSSLVHDIEAITGVPSAALRGTEELFKCSIEDRMEWTKARTTTIPEDKIYCLFGLFQVFLPPIYGEGEQHAKARLEGEIRKRQGDWSDYSSHNSRTFPPLPFCRNPYFQGRTEELRMLHEFFSQKEHRRMTIHGLGGSGKSALALEFAYRNLDQFADCPVFWISASSLESFELSCQTISLQMPTASTGNGHISLRDATRRHLELLPTPDWLLIVDNVDDLDVLISNNLAPGIQRLIDFVPSGRKGKVIFTTRSRKVAGTLTPGRFVELGTLTESVALELFDRRVGKPDLVRDVDDVKDTLRMLAYLPLAVVQAAGFMKNNNVSISTYKSLLQNASTESDMFEGIFDDTAGISNEDPGWSTTVARTWYISFERIRQDDHLAAQYLSFMGCIDRIGIAQSLLPPADSPLAQIKALGTLQGYSFITQQQPGMRGDVAEPIFDMHGLVHRAIARWLHERGELKGWLETCVTRLVALIPTARLEGKETWSLYVPHATYLANTFQLDAKSKLSLLDRVGQGRSMLGHFSAAERAYRQGLSIRALEFGSDHIDTLTSASNVATALHEQGHHDEAEPLERQILKQREELLGPAHADTLTSMSSLALLLDKRGELDEAENLNRKALTYFEKVFGVDHQNTMISTNNLALILDHKRSYVDAESMHRKTLARREKVLGPDHPDTLISVGNLAITLGNQGKHLEAQIMMTETLARYKKVFGEQHPHTLVTMDALAQAIGCRGNFEEALSIHQEAYTLFKENLGLEHPHTLTAGQHLADVLHMVRRFSEAEGLSRKMLHCREKVLGVDHIDTMTSVQRLAAILAGQNHLAESAALYQRAVAGLAKCLGADHRLTQACREQRSVLLHTQQKSRHGIAFLAMPRKYALRGLFESLRSHK